MTYEWLWQNCEMQGISQIHASKIWLNFQFEKVAFWCEYFCILKADLNLEDYDLRPSQDEDGDELADLQPEPDRPDQHSVQQHLQLHLHEEQVRLRPQHQINKLLEQIQELDIWCLFCRLLLWSNYHCSLLNVITLATSHLLLRPGTGSLVSFSAGSPPLWLISP